MSWQRLPLARICYDATRGVPGIIWPIGTPAVPSNTIADVLTLLTNRNLKEIDIHGAVTIVADVSHKDLFGHYHESVDDIVTLGAGNDVSDCHIRGLIITGAQAGDGLATYKECLLLNMTGFRGLAENCAIYGSLAVAVGASGFADFDHCTSVHGGITVTIGAPNRVSFKEFSGGMILADQTDGAVLVRGISGYLEVDNMDGGTLDIYAHGADIQIDADCGGGEINIYGDARVTIVGAPTATINDYTKETQLDRTLFTMDFWSLPQDVVTIPVGPADQPLPNVSVAGLPDGATIERAIAMFKFRMVENDNVGANALNGNQVIQVAPNVDAINFVDNQFTLAAETREGGDVVVGAIDIAATVNADAAYVFHWESAQADVASIIFSDIQMGIRIWYSV